MEASRASGRPVLVYFSAPWCYLCRKMQRLVFPDPAVSAMMGREFILAAVDVSQQERVKELYAITEVPTTIFLDTQGEPVLRLRGYLDRRSLTRAMRYVSQGQYRRMDWDAYCRRD